MTRPRKAFPIEILVDFQQLDSFQAQIENDAEFGRWCRKAIRDIRSGCTGKDVDELVSEAFVKAMKKMANRQSIDAQKYKRKKELKVAAASTRKTEDELRKASKSTTMETSHTSTHISDARNQESGTTATLSLLPPEEKHAYGEFGHVMLTTGEGQKLRELYGEKLELAIDILDSWIHNNSRKASKYKSHYAVMRKSGWVWVEVQERTIKDNQLVKSQMIPKSFQQQERERSARGAEYLLSMQKGVV